MAFLPVLGKILGAVTGLGGILGKQQEGAAKGALTQAELQQRQDQNALDRYRLQQDAQFTAGSQDLQRKQFEQQGRGTNAKQALLAALLGGDFQPSQVSVPGIRNANVSGGLAASLKNSPGVLAAMQKLAQQASTAQDTPLSFQGGQVLGAPSLTPLAQPSKGNSFLNTLARITQVAGSVAPFIPTPKKKAPDIYIPPGAGGSF